MPNINPDRWKQKGSVTIALPIVVFQQENMMAKLLDVPTCDC